MAEAQKPLELILARNLLSSISTPAFLVDERGTLVFFNEAAGALVGRRFEETGALEPREWGEAFGPFDAGGRRIPWDQLPLTIALRHGRPKHALMHIHGGDATCARPRSAPCPSSAPGASGAPSRSSGPS